MAQGVVICGLSGKKATFASFLFGSFNFVVVNRGKEILLLETNSGTAVGGYMQQ